MAGTGYPDWRLLCCNELKQKKKSHISAPDFQVSNQNTIFALLPKSLLSPFAVPLLLHWDKERELRNVHTQGYIKTTLITTDQHVNTLTVW